MEDSPDDDCRPIAQVDADQKVSRVDCRVNWRNCAPSACAERPSLDAGVGGVIESHSGRISASGNPAWWWPMIVVEEGVISSNHLNEKVNVPWRCQPATKCHINHWRPPDKTDLASR